MPRRIPQDPSEQEVEELLDKEQLTRKQASKYCQQALDIGRSTYYKYIYPLLRDHFYPYVYYERPARPGNRCKYRKNQQGKGGQGYCSPHKTD